MPLLRDCGYRKKKKNQISQQKNLPGLFFPALEMHTSPRQKLSGITFPNHWKMPAHPFLLVAMVRDDGAQPGIKEGVLGEGI